MVDQVQDIDSLKKEVEKQGQVVEAVNILFLDISSSCIGYSIASVNFSTKQVLWKSAGAIWTDPDWSHQEKYSYAFHALSSYFWIVEAIDYVVVEQYSVNPKKMMGINVVSEMQGAIKAGAWENGVKVTSILPQTWRSILGIKKDKPNNDWKGPTKTYVNQKTQIPADITSNITGKLRQTPSDLYDALAIGMAWLVRLGFPDASQDFSKLKVCPHIGHNLGV
jgi:Holliday junction resolvasome RuvABC endonuclease subunit